VGFDYRPEYGGARVELLVCLVLLGFLYGCLELLGDVCVVFREVEVGAGQVL
jgi:hypothetical protein